MDKYLWLEEVLDEKSLAWARKQNERTFAGLTKSAEFEATVNDLTEILSSKDKIMTAHFMNDGYVYHFWTDEKNVQGLLKRITIADYRNDQPSWETVIDYDELSRIDGEKWVHHGIEFSPDNSRALVFLSPGGSDADIMREFDMTTKTFLKDGFTLPISKGSATWLSNDELFLERDFGPDSVTASGYANAIRRWKRGEKLEDSKIIFTIPNNENAVSISAFHQKGQSRFIIYRRHDFYNGQTYVYENDVVTELSIPKKCDTDFNSQAMFILLREDWNGFKSGDYVAYDFQSKNAEVIFSPKDRKSVQGTGLTKDGVVLIIDQDVTSSLFYFSKQNGKWESIKLDLPSNGSLDFLTTSRSLNTYYVGFDSLNIPVSYFECEGSKVHSLVKKQKAFFNYEDIELSQHFATSPDGTKVPYFLAHKKGLVLNGKNPTILYGYGGFEISLKAHFSNLLGSAWLSRGGVYVLSNIRGGGEYGPEWHQCALKGNRVRTYQDFFAVAEELIEKKITSREHLGAWGGSNGGLLMGVCYTQRPDLFAAINCAVPLLDMQRYHKLLAGYSWIAEYGNPDDEEDGRYIRGLSPYQRIKKDEKNYPMMYLNTSTKDDRVHPGHARKFAAILEEYGHPYFYHENIEGGHAGASNFRELAFNKAMDYEFFWKYLK